MSFLAKFFVELDGEELSSDGLNVLQCTFNFNQPIDLNTGIANGQLQAGLINLDIESSKSPMLLRWICRHQLGKGKIVFHRRETDETIEKELEFDHAHLVEYRESFNATDSGPMVTHLEIFAGIITIVDSVFSTEQQWTESDDRYAR